MVLNLKYILCFPQNPLGQFIMQINIRLKRPKLKRKRREKKHETGAQKQHDWSQINSALHEKQKRRKVKQKWETKANYFITYTLCKWICDLLWRCKATMREWKTNNRYTIENHNYVCRYIVDDKNRYSSSLLLFSQEHFEAKGDLKKSWNQEKSW